MKYYFKMLDDYLEIKRKIQTPSQTFNQYFGSSKIMFIAQKRMPALFRNCLLLIQTEFFRP